MFRPLSDVVLRAPFPIRWAMLNLMSLRLNFLRRAPGKDYHGARNLIREYHQKSAKEIRTEQQHRFAKLMAETVKHVPYYKELLGSESREYQLETIGKLPLLSKGLARKAGRRLLNDRIQRFQHYEGHTSGSTGTPFIFHWTYSTLRARFGMRDGFYRYHGFDFNDLNVRLGGRLFVSPDRQKPPFWIRDHISNQILFSTYHISNANMGAFVKALEVYHPSFVTGYPSSVHLLAQGCRQLGSHYRPVAVFTDSETVLDYQREEVQRGWGCEIHDYYGMEAGWICGQCREGRYHLSPLTSVVEILDEGGKPTPPGVMGEIVVTDLENPLMPLIRYQTGDLGVWSGQLCDCGWKTPTLERVEGRIDDVVILPDGRKIGRLDHILKKANSIKEAQLVQETVERFVLKVVPELGFDAKVKEKIVHEAKARLGRAVDFDIKLVSSLTKSPTGKLRSVISMLPSQEWVSEGPEDRETNGY